MNYFLCDINGTYDGKIVNRNESLKKLVENLKMIIEKDNLDKLYFSFISFAGIDSVIECMNELKKYIDDERIEITKSFGENKSYDFNKIEEVSGDKMSQVVSLLKNKQIDNVYFADDSEIFHMMINDCLYGCLKKATPDKNYVPYNNLTQFLLGSRNDEYEYSIDKTHLDALNILLGNYIYENKKIKKLDRKV